ncbi:protein transport protein SEC31 homolog A-like [Miscanthus floridulus]|uniref:protein transport protein SEC31 homolog A-like n=1 Tax=Miscanthus floridulus TaxID=154761 RepID=UPI00345958BA
MVLIAIAVLIIDVYTLVLGLSFSPTTPTPHFLASGGAKGTVLIWDLINPSAERIPHFQYNEDDNVQILDLSWNALKPNVITSASNVGVKILDISAKSSVIGKFSSMENCSAVEWCPTDKDTMVVASGNYCKVWDVRKVDKPLHQFSDTNSIVAISWCPFEKEIVLACTEEKLLLLNVKKGEVVHEY